MSDLKAPSPSTRPVGRLILIGLGILLVGFLVLGSLTQPSTPTQPGFGIQTQPFLVLVVLALFAGLLSFLSPCTLPILPAYFAFAFQSGKRQIALNTLVFMLGLATMFALMGASASVLGRLLLQNQQLILLLGGGLVLIFGVMSLLGKGFAGLSPQSEVVSNASLGGSFLFGLTFAVGWSSCVGPILGAVLTLAAQTASVLQGVMLLFIYALGLGLPLMVVSTFFGRASRKSLFWRVLKGKAWDVTTHVLVVGLLWALAIWRILVAAAAYAYREFAFLAGQSFTAVQEYGLLVLALAGVLLWIFTNPDKERRTTVQIHTTQTISGVLFILLGLLLLSGRLAAFNALVPPDLAIWFAEIEERLILLFN